MVWPAAAASGADKFSETGKPKGHAGILRIRSMTYSGVNRLLLSTVLYMFAEFVNVVDPKHCASWSSNRLWLPPVEDIFITP
jgi:hypothetical protein